MYWILNVLKNQGQNTTNYDKVWLYYIIILTVLIINDFMAIFLSTEYKKVAAVLIILFAMFILTNYSVLYWMFIKLFQE